MLGLRMSPAKRPETFGVGAVGRAGSLEAKKGKDSTLQESWLSGR